MPIALVTGAAHGLGAEVARQLAATGVEVVIASRDPQAAATAAAEQEGVRGFPQALDIADPTSVQQAAIVGLRRRDTGYLD